MATLTRIALVTSHPVQYQVPWIRKLAATPGVDLTVYYAMIPDAAEQGREFGVAFEWDIPLLGGYHHQVLANISSAPSVLRFGGCDTPEVYSLIRDGHFDAVIVNGWVVKTCIQALLACRRYGIPCIVRGEINGRRPRAAWKGFLHRLLLKQYSGFLAIGNANREYYLGRGVPADRIFSTPYCVDNERFAAAVRALKESPGQVALRREFGLAPELTTFLFCGKLSEKKRTGDLVSALAGVPTELRKHMQVLIIGDGPLRLALTASAAELPVHFAGFLNQSQIARAYAAADCLVLPSDHGETWGLVTNEAMASGLPAIVSDQVGCAEDLITPGETGDLYTCADVSALSRLLTLYGREELRAMGQKARARVLSEYNFDGVVDGVMACVRSLISETANNP